MIEIAIDIDNALLKNPDRFIPLLNKVDPRYILIASSRDLETCLLYTSPSPRDA